MKRSTCGYLLVPWESGTSPGSGGTTPRLQPGRRGSTELPWGSRCFPLSPRCRGQGGGAKIQPQSSKIPIKPIQNCDSNPTGSSAKRLRAGSLSQDGLARPYRGLSSPLTQEGEVKKPLRYPQEVQTSRIVSTTVRKHQKAKKLNVKLTPFSPQNHWNHSSATPSTPARVRRHGHISP